MHCVALTFPLTKLPDLGQWEEVKPEGADLCNYPGHGKPALNQNNVQCIRLHINCGALD